MILQKKAKIAITIPLEPHQTSTMHYMDKLAFCDDSLIASLHSGQIWRINPDENGSYLKPLAENP